ncbi:GOLPH3/VPS74 family protein [Candidatus Palauibacter sp.]|uniref:GOLPH3/VPS74 family protein n=1 Tax=Candidatus Palauibacter sp. TaxID=3101350 RepID=UPI003B019AC1
MLILLLDDEEGVFLPVEKVTLDYALVGAVMMDLAFEDRIDTDLTRFMVVDPSPTGDTTLDPVFRRIREGIDEGKDTRAVIEMLAAEEAGTIQDRTLDSLVERGIVERRDDSLSDEMIEHLFLFRSPRYPTIDDTAQREVKARMLDVLFSDEIPLPRDVALICLADACDILVTVFDPEDLDRSRPRIDLLSKMDLLGREVTGMIAEVKRSSIRALAHPRR